MNTTSLEAYQAIESSGAATLQRQKVWIALRLFGAMTRQEIADQTGIKLSSICGVMSFNLTRPMRGITWLYIPCL